MNFNHFMHTTPPSPNIVLAFIINSEINFRSFIVAPSDEHTCQKLTKPPEKVASLIKWKIKTIV